MLIDDVFDTGVRPNKDQLIAWGEGVEVNAISSKHFDIVADGSDQTTRIATALASGENIHFERGVIGYDGAAGLTFSLAGQTIHGSGTTDVATAPTRGTVFKRLSGTGVGLTVPLYLEGCGLENICFDQNNLGGSAVLFKGHKGRLQNLVFHNQAGTAFALRVSGVNLLQVDNIVGTGTNYGLLKVETDAVALYGAYYSSFSRIRSLNPTTSNAVLINGSSALTFIDTFVESEIYITAGNVDVRFVGLRGELGARSLMKVDGLNGGSSEVSVIGGKVNTFENGTATVFFFDIADAASVKIKDFSFTDNNSVAGRAYVNIANAQDFALEDVTARNGTANAHWLLTSTAAAARSEAISIRNARGLSGDVRIDAEMSGTIENTNMPITFIAGSQNIVARNCTGNINTANTSGLILEGCTGAITDTGRLATRYGYGGVIARLATVASAAELNLAGIDATDACVMLSGTTNVTSIRAADSIPGRRVTLFPEGVLTITDGNNLKLAGNYVTAANGSITLDCDASSNWIEAGRSAN